MGVQTEPSRALRALYLTVTVAATVTVLLVVIASLLASLLSVGVLAVGLLIGEIPWGVAVWVAVVFLGGPLLAHAVVSRRRR